MFSVVVEVSVRVIRCRVILLKTTQMVKVVVMSSVGVLVVRVIVPRADLLHVRFV